MTEKPSPAELLAEWRSAERLAEGAKDAESVTSLAKRAAARAKVAALDSREASVSAAEAARSAQWAAGKAQKASEAVVDAAEQLAATAEGDYARAVQAVEETGAAETLAHDSYRQLDKDHPE